MTQTLAIGDYLTRPKKDMFRGIITHVGAVVGYNMVLQNTPNKGEHVTTFEKFADGEPVTVHKTNANPTVVQANAQRVIANRKPYHPIVRNCEQTATEVVEGKPRSPQLGKVILIIIAIVAVICGLVALLKRKR